MVPHKQVAQAVRGLGGPHAILEAQVGPGDDDLVRGGIEGEGSELALQGGEAIGEGQSGAIPRGDRLERPAEDAEDAEAPGQAAPPAEPPVDGVGLLVQGVDLMFERIEAGVECIHAVVLLWGRNWERGAAS
jgi:hypothetical protein